ncbi:unnamed protein product [Heligmosomoides polygyrus]|uniref:Carn_acyltransf domain-containing protein n=1 Tax=Heligmosomoides polygyrus TaxID=6339 RepID=A0A183FTR4_HELPZ|nr:unnamed protein product [Heligmosomoides polygyrus]
MAKYAFKSPPRHPVEVECAGASQKGLSNAVLYPLLSFMFLNPIRQLRIEERPSAVKVRSSMIANSENNASCFQTVEEACFSLTLADCSYENTPDVSARRSSDMQWADKSVNIIACKDGRMLVQAEVTIYFWGSLEGRSTNFQIKPYCSFGSLYFAPIYETASTRKFFHGRTETVRGRTQEMLKRFLYPKDVQTEEQKRLFMAAYEVHNKLMDDATNGNGIDRHFYGLRKTLEMHQKGCSPKINAPAIFTDEAWKLSGGDGNFLLSTSFVGYMGENDEVGGYGYVTAMRPDGYGAFYRIGRNRSVQKIDLRSKHLHSTDDSSHNVLQNPHYTMCSCETVLGLLTNFFP